MRRLDERIELARVRTNRAFNRFAHDEISEEEARRIMLCEALDAATPAVRDMFAEEALALLMDSAELVLAHIAAAWCDERGRLPEDVRRSVAAYLRAVADAVAVESEG